MIYRYNYIEYNYIIYNGVKVLPFKTFNQEVSRLKIGDDYHRPLDYDIILHTQDIFHQQNKENASCSRIIFVIAHYLTDLIDYIGTNFNYVPDKIFNYNNNIDPYATENLHYILNKKRMKGLETLGYDVPEEIIDAL
jgi:hypothetical protein